MKIALALLIAAFVAGPAAAADCVYVNKDVSPQAEIRFDRRAGTIAWSSDGTRATLADESAGTGISTRVAYFPGSDDGVPYWFVDLKPIAKIGAPDHVLIFGTDAYWPECG